MYRFNKEPTGKEIEKCVEEHNTKYIDYVRVWFDDGTNAVYYNTHYEVSNYFDYLGGNHYKLTFYNPVLIKPGSFRVLGIIRSKRVIYPIDKSPKLSYNILENKTKNLLYY